MTVWRLNSTVLANCIVTARKINTPWAQVARGIYGKKALVSDPNNLAQPITLDISCRGSDRFTMESTIRTILEKSPIILIKSTDKYIYEDKKQCWIVPSGMNVTDGGAKKPLKITISGLIDERTIHSCDFVGDWSGGTVTIATGTRVGRFCIKDTMSTDEDHYTIYALPESTDFTKAVPVNESIVYKPLPTRQNQ